MNTFFIFLLVIITLADYVTKVSILNKGGQINNILNSFIEKIGTSGYLIIVLIALAVVSLINSMILSLVLISLMSFNLSESLKQLNRI